MHQTVNFSRLKTPFWRDVPRVRFTACLVLYGGALGASTLLVSLLAQTAQKNYPAPPVHMSILPSLFLSAGAAIVGVLLSVLIALWLVRDADKARNLLIWEAIGFAFGVTLPFFTGMLLPMSGVFLSLAMGVLTWKEFFVEVASALFQAPVFAFSHGVFGLFTGLLGGFIFGTGAWLIDTANASSNRNVSRYSAYAISIALSIGVLAIAAYGSPSFLARLG